MIYFHIPAVYEMNVVLKTYYEKETRFTHNILGVLAIIDKKLNLSWQHQHFI